VAFLLLITFPLFYVLKTCFDESRELTLRVSAFLEHNEQFQRLLSDYEKSEVYIWAKNYAASWGYDVKDLQLDSLRAYIVDAIKLIGKKNRIEKKRRSEEKRREERSSWKEEEEGTLFSFIPYWSLRFPNTGSNVSVFFGGAVAIAANVGSIVVSIGIFISCLFYFLVVRRTDIRE
jgi:hypothetical protein